MPPAKCQETGPRQGLAVFCGSNTRAMFRYLGCRRCRRCRHVWAWLWWRAVALTLLIWLLYTVFTLPSSVVPEPNIRSSGNDAKNPETLFDHRYKTTTGSTMKDSWDRDPAARMRQRQEVLTRYCSAHWDGDANEDGGTPAFRTNSLITRRHSVLFCPVAKAASTLLLRFLVAAEQANPVISPYRISVEKAMRMREIRTGSKAAFTALYQLALQPGREEEEALANVARRVLFVRCPFQRLWSAYVDKLLYPNPHYWEAWGGAALLLNASRRAASPAHQQKRDREPAGSGAHPGAPHPLSPPPGRRGPCGGTPDVTFSQFLRLVVGRLHRSDPHVRPASWECSPCHVRFNVIGHAETLADDVAHLADLMGLEGRNATLRRLDWGEELARDAIEDAAKNVFVKWGPMISECGLSKEEAARRVWRVFQVRGFISADRAFPVAGDPRRSRGEEGVQRLYAVAMKNALLEARAASVKRVGEGELAKQKRAAFLQAYSAVDAGLKESIRKVYKADFEMFGFDFLPHL